MFKAPFSFEGRIRRTEYGISAIIFILLIILIEFLADKAQFLELLFIPLLWFIIAQGAKRCHDKSKEGWYQMIPFYVFALVFFVGDKTQNRYGKNPKTDS
jgi:uncharacterized membrane protein YhaH (DUF805 family)